MGTLAEKIESFVSSGSVSNLAALGVYVNSGEFRDEDFSESTYSAVVELLEFHFNPHDSNRTDHGSLQDIRDIIERILSADEFQGPDAGKYFESRLISKIVNRLSPSQISQVDTEDECAFIESLLLILYRKVVGIRAIMRSEIGRFLHDFAQIPTRTSHLSPILRVLNRIIRGIPTADRRLFAEILLPLHKPNGWSFWDRQTPILGEYHKALVECCHSMIEKDTTLASSLVDYILSQGFPVVNQSNTAKELLLLFEISKFLDKVSDLRPIMPKLMTRILDSVNSENAQVVQSVLVYWKSPPSTFPERLKPFLAQYIDSLIVALFRGNGEPHWNPTVNKMTLLVLRCLESSNPELFASSAQKCIPSITLSDSLPVRAVPKSLAASVEARNQPPLEITGVAPWMNEPVVSPRSADRETDRQVSGLGALRLFMNRLEPATVSEKDDKPWQTALSVDSPTLLPDLKFHNLVFGKDLGYGSFSTVRYARVIRPKSYLSQWDEVAVKCITYDTIRKHNYGENILREISCLRRLSHPSVARLISSFRWRDGIYMVLEYGSFGDLHTYVRKNGPLAEETAKIVIGEIATALAAVHETGFVYGDLKPENVILTATRHVKLADFGACRPFTSEARRMLLEARDDLMKMRSGDWKTDDPSSGLPPLELTDEQILTPKTFEGTTAYMSPEIVSSPGLGPTLMSDAYALGLTTYFVLKGRLPQWTAQEENITHFDPSKMMESDPLFEEISSECSQFLLGLVTKDPSTRITVQEALDSEWFSTVQPVRRLYQRNLNNDHLTHADDGGPLASKASETAWEKRQLSKIWTAQPADYALGASRSEESGTKDIIEETEIERGSPFI